MENIKIEGVYFGKHFYFESKGSMFFIDPSENIFIDSKGRDR